MKVFLDARGLKEANVLKLKEAFPQIEFSSVEEEALDAEVIFGYPDFFGNEKMDQFRHLKWVQLYTAGFDTVDLEYFRKRNILVTNGKGVYSKTIAEDVLTKVLALNRNVGSYFEQMKTQTWKQLKSEFELTDSTVGIIGTGSIGQEIAKRFKAFETTVLGHKRTPSTVEYFDEILTGDEGLTSLLRRSDVVVLALPLNKESYHLINMDRLRLMKKTAILINIARGDVIKQDDLISALEQKIIRGAALDVTTPEPLPTESPLWRFPQVLITPHNAMSSPFLIGRLHQLLIENINEYLTTGQVKNVVKE